MTKLQDDIADAFLEKLKDSTEISPAMLDGLRQLLASDKKLKPDDLVKVFSPPAGGEVK